jgi:hypothetical protein
MTYWHITPWYLTQFSTESSHSDFGSQGLSQERSILNSVPKSIIRGNLVDRLYGIRIPKASNLFHFIHNLQDLDSFVPWHQLILNLPVRYALRDAVRLPEHTMTLYNVSESVVTVNSVCIAYWNWEPEGRF